MIIWGSSIEVREYCLGEHHLGARRLSGEAPLRCANIVWWITTQAQKDCLGTSIGRKQIIWMSTIEV